MVLFRARAKKRIASKIANKMKLRFAWHVASAIGISILQQLIGLFRQVLIAAFFGLSREFDAYVVVYALVTMVVFNLAGVFDTVAVARLVQIREKEGEENFWRTSNRILLQSCAFGAVFAAVTVSLLW